ncbi:MAG: MarR family transcriptional regulator [Proteobacteria bacterium]|nr:MarR family transcriptional regulator [Pseudomonadota bacterium]NOG61181.1 MarR family transcriptional regulator [Pseudomonadota bacterium]
MELNYREGELENLLRVRDRFVDLIGLYSNESTTLSKSKMLGTIFDTVFFIGISNLRHHMPSVKEVYLNVGEPRNKSLRNLELLEEMRIVTRVHDKNDSRVKRVRLTDKFKDDFDSFVSQWVDSRKPQAESA